MCLASENTTHSISNWKWKKWKHLPPRLKEKENRCTYLLKRADHTFSALTALFSLVRRYFIYHNLGLSSTLFILLQFSESSNNQLHSSRISVTVAAALPQSLRISVWAGKHPGIKQKNVLITVRRPYRLRSNDSSWTLTRVSLSMHSDLKPTRVLNSP